MTDYEKALKDAHEHADKALDKVEDAAKSARDRFKAWLDNPWRTVTRGEAIVGGALLILFIIAAL